MQKTARSEQKSTYEDLVALFPGSKQAYNVGVMAAL
jgi:hypothetical protein